jgi:hypothetical protein
VAAGTLLEIAIPLADLQPPAGTTTPPSDRELSFFVAVYREDREAERHPGHRPIETRVPDAQFESRHWTA